MLKRIEPEHPGEAFSIEDAREYAEMAKKSAKMMFSACLKEIKNLDVKGKYLEIGPGPGILTAIISEDKPDVNITALELSPAMVTIAQEYINERNLQDRIHFIVGDASNEEVMEKLGKFDLVYCTYTMHEWAKPEKVISNLVKALNDNGVLYIYDLRRIWWLYYLPVRSSGFIESVRAAYIPSEIKVILQKVGITQYEIKRHFPFFIQSIILRK